MERDSSLWELEKEEIIDCHKHLVKILPLVKDKGDFSGLAPANFAPLASSTPIGSKKKRNNNISNDSNAFKVSFDSTSPNSGLGSLINTSLPKASTSSSSITANEFASGSISHLSKKARTRLFSSEPVNKVPNFTHPIPSVKVTPPSNSGQPNETVPLQTQIPSISSLTTHSNYRDNSYSPDHSTVSPFSSPVPSPANSSFSPAMSDHLSPVISTPPSTPQSLSDFLDGLDTSLTDKQTAVSETKSTHEYYSCRFATECPNKSDLLTAARYYESYDIDSRPFPVSLLTVDEIFNNKDFVKPLPVNFQFISYHDEHQRIFNGQTHPIFLPNASTSNNPAIPVVAQEPKLPPKENMTVGINHNNIDAVNNTNKFHESFQNIIENPKQITSKEVSKCSSYNFPDFITELEELDFTHNGKDVNCSQGSNICPDPNLSISHTAETFASAESVKINEKGLESNYPLNHHSYKKHSENSSHEAGSIINLEQSNDIVDSALSIAGVSFDTDTFDCTSPASKQSSMCSGDISTNYVTADQNSAVLPTFDKSNAAYARNHISSTMNKANEELNFNNDLKNTLTGKNLPSMNCFTTLSNTDILDSALSIAGVFDEGET